MAGIQSSQAEQERLKIVLIGRCQAGKTSIKDHILYGCINSDYQRTYGMNLDTRFIQADNRIFRLQLWDTSEQEYSRPSFRSYIEGSEAVVLVYDVCSRESFDYVLDLQRENDMLGTKEMIKILVGNKTDIAHLREVSFKQGFAAANELGFAFFETSANSGENVNALFQYIMRESTEYRE